MRDKIPSYLLESSSYRVSEGKEIKLSFLDRTLLNAGKTVKSIHLQAENASKERFVHKINPVIKLISLIYLAVMISFAQSLYAQTITLVFIVILFISAGINVFQMYCRILFVAFMFGFLVVFPASLNIITRGDIIFKLIRLERSYHFWGLDIPQSIGFTANGFQVVSLIFLRVLNSISFAMLIVFTTPFTSLIRSLKSIGVPDTFLMIISLAFKYIFILCRTIEETYHALKSRLSGNIKSSRLRKLVGGRVLYIFQRSQAIYEGTYCAMVSRGFTGRIRLPSQIHLNYRDIVSLLVVTTLGIVIILI